MATTTTTSEFASELATKIFDGPGGYAGVEPTEEWAAEIKRLAKARNAVLLAHNY